MLSVITLQLQTTSGNRQRNRQKKRQTNNEIWYFWTSPDDPTIVALPRQAAPRDTFAYSIYRFLTLYLPSHHRSGLMFKCRYTRFIAFSCRIPPTLRFLLPLFITSLPFPPSPPPVPSLPHEQITQFILLFLSFLLWCLYHRPILPLIRSINKQINQSINQLSIFLCFSR